MDLRNELKIQGGGGMKLSVQEVNRRVEVEAVELRSAASDGGGGVLTTH